MSDGAAAQIETLGAELRSLKDVFGTEYIWQGDARYWGRRSPLLFPVIGEQKGGYYAYAGKRYSIGRHGFARDREFEVVTSEKSRAVLSLVSDDSTLAVYPFRFRLYVSFELEGTVLTVSYRVENTGECQMFFSIGGHTGYNCPLVDGDSFEDYLIEYEKPETFDRLIVGPDGLYTGESEPFLKGERSFGLSHVLFSRDAIVPSRLLSRRIDLVSRRTGRGVRVEFGDFKTLAVWSAGDAPFVCLEPWNGRASGSDDGPSLEEKHGIVCLSEGSFYGVSHSISLL